MLHLSPERNLDVNLRKSEDHEQEVYSLPFIQAFQNNDECTRYLYRSKMVLGTCTSLLQTELYNIFMKNAQISVIAGSGELEIAHIVFKLTFKSYSIKVNTNVKQVKI